MNIIEFNNVWKKFRRGEKFNSLRDAVPYYTRLLLSRGRIPEDLTLQSSEFWALQDLSFSVKKGDILGIIGPNGAGKSTVLKLLSRIMEPNRGHIAISGRLSALIEVTAGFHPELTGKENIYLNGTILGMSRKEIDRKFDRIVEFSGLSDFVDTPVKRYSSGMYSRLGFSVAAHMDPDILLVDEVLSVGDIAFQSKCVRKMKELLTSGATIVLVSHDLALVQNLCRRVILVDGGRAVTEGPATDIIRYYQDLVYKKSEEELRREIATSEYRVKVREAAKVIIADVVLSDGSLAGGDRFKTGQPLHVRIDFEALEKIEDPVFALDIVRSDGIVCCSSNTKADGVSLGPVCGKGALHIDLGKMHLAPGIYIAKVSIWDREMLHPYAVRKNDIFRFEPDGSPFSVTHGVFLQKFNWRYLLPQGGTGW